MKPVATLTFEPLSRGYQIISNATEPVPAEDRQSAAERDLSLGIAQGSPGAGELPPAGIGLLFPQHRWL
jgi:hypothetical protein